jgi:hypothetical protein
MKCKPAYLWILALCLSCLACATTQVQDIKPGEKPALESDEAGLWMAMDDIEANLKTSGRVEHDPDLNAYVNKILCKLQPEYCNDIRYVIVQTPHFNASMAPNGFMQVWTGLMLRAQNEDGPLSAAPFPQTMAYDSQYFQRAYFFANCGSWSRRGVCRRYRLFGCDGWHFCLFTGYGARG